MPVTINRPTLIRPYLPARPQTQSEGCSCGGCGCAACGGLECYCRPRFFAGQLLSDEDLNRLDRYITGKERLHNRYLHGWGVVCGLEVLCDPCDGYVTVSAGYALSPCGDDIVVCEDDSVNICELLQKCRDQDSHDCQPLRPYNNQGNWKDLGEEWILVICYEERATRGVMPLRNPKQSGNCSRCGCGGSKKQNGKSCGCGCHGQSNATTSTRTQSFKPVPAQCEPTSTCESYHFELRRAATLSKGSTSTNAWTKATRSTLAENASYVLDQLRASVPPPPTTTTRSLWQNWYSNVRGIYHEAIRLYGGYNCAIDDAMQRIPYPNPDAFESDNQWVSAVRDNVTELTRVAAEYLQPLICAALLPPCPPPSQDNCVPLAKLHIDTTTCRVREICNIDVRKLVITFPTIQYWLSLVTKGVNWEAILERLCCTPQRTDYVRVKGFGTVALQSANNPTFSEQPRSSATMEASASATSATMTSTESEVATKVAATASPLLGLFRSAAARQSEPVNTYMLLLDALGAVTDRNTPLISAEERANPIESLLLNQVVFPAIQSFVPPDRGSTGTTTGTNTGANTDNAADLKELRAMMEKQQETIDALRQEVEKLRSKN